MTIANEIKTRRIEITCLDAEKDILPSYQLRIEIHTEEICGIFDRDIWVEENRIEEFIEALSRLEKSRNGEVKLASIIPSEFSLKFRNADQLGHLLVEVRMQKDEVDWYADFIRIQFEIEPTSLPRIIVGWKGIIHKPG